MKLRPRFSRLVRAIVITLLLTAAMGTLALAEQAGYLMINTWFSGAWNTYIRQFNTDGNQYLSEEEIAAIEEVDVHGMGLDSMTGLQLLTSLRSLDCSDNELTAIGFHNPKYVVTATSLNIRKGASSSYPIVGTTHKGDAWTVYSINNGWAKVIFNGNTCYMQADYLVLTGDDDLPIRYLSCYGNSLEKLNVSYLPFILDACTNGTKDTSNPDYDQYESELGLLRVDKNVRIITGATDFTVRWFDLEGSVLDERIYPEDMEEPVTDLIPASLEDEHFIYEFSGWDEGTWVNSTEKEYWPEYTRVVKPGVSGSFSGSGVLTAEVYAPAGSRLIAASYDAAGRLLNVRIRSITSSTGMMNLSLAALETESGGVCKLLLTDAAWFPLCPQWTGACP